MTFAATCLAFIRRVARVHTRLPAGVAVALLAAAPAWAGTQTMPGVMCQSEGAVVDRPVSGALLNGVVSSSGYTKFHCPIIRTEPVSSYAATLSVTLHARVNYSYTGFECTLRSARTDGTVVDFANVFMPSKATGNGGNASASISVTLLPMFVTSAYLRCNVPNVYAGELAGIISYVVTD